MYHKKNETVPFGATWMDVVNSDAMNTELGACFQISFFWRYAQ